MNVLLLFGLTAEDQQALTALPGVHVFTPDTLSAEDWSQIDVILGWSELGAKLLAGPNRVKFIQAMSAGVDYLPLTQLQAQGAVVANTSGIHAQGIAEHVLGGVLAYARGLRPVVKETAGEWADTARRHQIWEPAGTKALIYGTGHIGQRTAQLLHAIGMTTLGISEHGQAKPHFDQVGVDADSAAFATQATVIVNIMPLTAATKHFFAAAYFQALTQQPLFVNVGRGPSVDTAALVEALQDGHLRAAVLDVFEQEPLPQDSPLYQLPNVLLTPHIAGTTPHKRAEVYEIFSENLIQFMKDGTLARNQIDYALGY